jgi:hypothetical protein
MSGFKLPGVAWTALLVAIPSIVGLINDNWGTEQWAVIAVGVLLTIAKVIEVLQAGAKEAALAATPPSFDAGGEFVERETPNVWWG